MSRETARELAEMVRSGEEGHEGAARLLLQKTALCGLQMEQAIPAITAILLRGQRRSYAPVLEGAEEDAKAKEKAKSSSIGRALGKMAVPAGAGAVGLMAGLALPKLRSMLRHREIQKMQKEQAEAARNAALAQSFIQQQNQPPPAPPPQEPPTPTVLHIHHRQPAPTPPPPPPDPPPVPRYLRVGPTISRAQEIPMSSMPSVYNHPIFGQERVYTSQPIGPLQGWSKQQMPLNVGAGLRNQPYPQRFSY